MAISQIQNQLKAQRLNTEREVEKFTVELKRFLDSALEEIVGEIVDGNVAPAAALGSLLEAFRARGLDEKLAEMSTLYGSELRQVMETLQSDGIPLDLRVLDTSALEALIQFRVEDAQAKTLNRITSMRPVILESIILGNRPDIPQLQQRFTTLTETELQTELNTGLMTFNRMVNAAQAEALEIELFLYVGVNDDLTRPFCEDLLAKDPPIYTRDEIDQMDNGQLGDVLATGGGYNCRHHWRPVSQELAERLGYDD